MGAGYQPALRGEERLRDWIERALDVLEELGGLAELADGEKQLVIRGQSCPLAAAVWEHPDGCTLAEALLEELIGAPVQETCARNGTPQCNFRITASP